MPPSFFGVLASVCGTPCAAGAADPLLVPAPLLVQATDLLHPSAAAEKRKHKLKRLVQAPNSFFMDVRCPGCLTMYGALPAIVPLSAVDRRP